MRRWLTETAGGLPRTFWHLWTVTLVNSLGGFVGTFLTLYLSTVRHFDASVIGVMLGGLGLGAVVGTQVAGVLADRWGRRKTLLLANAMTVAVLLSLAVVRDVVGIGLLLVVLGASQNMARPAFSAMIADLIPAAERVRAYNLNYWAINLGFAGAAILAGFAMSLTPWLIFVINAGAVASTGLLVLLRIPETRPTAVPVPDSTRTLKQGGSFAVILRDRVFLVFVLLTFLPSFLMSSLGALLPLQVTARGLTPQEYSWIIATNGVIIVFGQLFIPRLVDGKRRTRVLALASLFWAAGVGVTGLATGVPVFMLTVLVWTIGEMLQTPANSATVADLSPADMRGRYQAMFSLAWQAAMLAAPVLGGLGLKYLGGMWWAVAAAIGVAAAVGNLLAEPSRTRRLATAAKERELTSTRG
ncbi:MFS transporter [Actinorhabdospora filicis]|uniref:MFS transporter n=1 Tax=Actinorhabdospora filicis TaxID=1785913 RepID=A0A9W6SKG9_9ACTN|nr:MFS transporter [Actinorhabdospora filicis]GLZ77319.1 MFS transporter [Actinorhabdospora filicis]